MKVLRRVLAGLTILLAVAMLLLSLAGGVGVWIVKEPATSHATHVFEWVGATLDIADEGLDHVKTSLDRAEERLASVREEQRKLAQDSPQGDMMRRFLARTVRQTVAPEIDDAHEQLHAVAEAAVVVNSMLADVGRFPFLAESGLDVGALEEINGQLANVAPAAFELSRLLGDRSPDADAQLSRVEQALQAIRGLIAEYEPKLTQVRRHSELLKTKTLTWVTPAAVIVSSVCFWIALSQVSLMRHAWSWWGRAGQKPSRPS
jgi:hypothetical protein